MSSLLVTHLLGTILGSTFVQRWHQVEGREWGTLLVSSTGVTFSVYVIDHNHLIALVHFFLFQFGPFISLLCLHLFISFMKSSTNNNYL